jgi:enterochelin esterase-like enzyme
VTVSRLVRHEAFHSVWLERDRDITVYLPASVTDPSGATTSSEEDRPCLILHDGQNLFDPARAYAGHHWRVAETADRLIAEGAIGPLVIVGVDHGGDDRLREYTPTPGREPGAGLAPRHARFVVDELLPFLTSTYGISRSPSRLGVGGSSLGGLVSLYVASAEPGVFGRVLAMSPSVWWDRRAILKQLQEAPFEGRPRVWIDAGADEGTRTVSDARRLAQLVRRQGHVRFVEAPGAGHNEDSWAARLGEALVYLFGRG